MKKTIIFVLGLVLTGCSTKIGLAPTVSHSGFDNSQVVNIVPHATRPASVFDPVTINIGAQWNAAHGDVVVLTIQVNDAFNGYHAITGAKFNIDGEITALTPVVGSETDFSSLAEGAPKVSSRDFVTTVAVVEKILHSHRTWVRVSTPSGTVEDAVIDGDKDSKAFNALIRFMNLVKANPIPPQ